MTLLSKIILYVDLILMGLIGIVVWGWQLQVLRGRTMKNPDGTVDDWHEQKILYGMALADLTVGVPGTLTGIFLIFWGWGLGYYLTGLASFWWLWANVMTTATSLRFEKPRITFIWLVTFPLGAILGGIYILWSIVHFEEIFRKFY
jgi:hypothetical protein